MSKYTIGADISKDHIDLYRPPDGARLQAANDRKGFAEILNWIGERQVERIVYEPTGAFHKAFERFMIEKSFGLSKVNPRSARRFAEATGKLAKTDRADAAMLARFGIALEPRLMQDKSPEFNDLKELHIARLGLVKDRVAAKNRQKILTLSLLKTHNAERLQQIEHQIRQIDKAILALIQTDPVFKARFEIIVSIPGISKITAFALLIEMPELGTLDEKQAAALAGLAPISRQSGRWTGRAFIAGGRAIVRKALYMPAIAAMCHNSDLRDKYNALIAAGKPPKVAIAALMRKLVVLANALLRKSKKWAPKTA